MSRQIGELERTLGFELFRRKGRSIEITEAGRELALLMASFFSEFERIAERGTQVDASLRIGAGASVFEAFVFPRLRELEAEFPKCRFDFCGFSTGNLLNALSEGEIDLGIVPSGQNFSGVTEVPAGNISFVLVGRSDFDSQLPNWSLSTFLSRVPLVLIGGKGRWIDAFHRLCLQMEVKPRIAHRAETFAHVRELLKAGAPACFLPRPLASSLPASEFTIIDDKSFALLNRPLSVVYDNRASRVRDRLESMAQSLANVLA